MSRPSPHLRRSRRVGRAGALAAAVGLAGAGALAAPVAGAGAADGPRAVAARMAPRAAAPPRAALQDLACQRAVDPPGRSVGVTAVMRPVSGTYRLSVRFDLQRRVHRTGPFTAVHGHELGRWIYPTDPANLGQLPGDVWRPTQNVLNLAGPAYYRFRVGFRWLAADGRILAATGRVSSLCFQPEPRADLQVGSLAVRPATAGRDRYLAVIRNTGATRTGRFTVELEIPGSPAETATVPGLAAAATIREAFTGPACAAGDQLTVIADPDRRVDDFRRANNLLTAACPGPASP